MSVAPHAQVPSGAPVGGGRRALGPEPLLELIDRHQWAGAWPLARILFALVALRHHLLRGRDAQDALETPNIVFNAGPLHLADQVLIGPVSATFVWILGIIGLSGLLYGGRLSKPGLTAWLLSTYTLIATCGLQARVPERFALWASLVLIIAPIGERGLLRAYRSPFARQILLVVLGSLYLSTGIMKAVEEPAWWTGEAIAYDLLDRFHAGGPISAWASGQPAICLLLSWYTLVFEIGFVFLVGLSRTNPFIVLMGIGLHLGIGMLMDVGALGEMVLALYPVLLCPDQAERWTRSWIQRYPALLRV